MNPFNGENKLLYFKEHHWESINIKKYHNNKIFAFQYKLIKNTIRT